MQPVLQKKLLDDFTVLRDLLSAKHCTMTDWEVGFCNNVMENWILKLKLPTEGQRRSLDKIQKKYGMEWENE